VDIFVLNSEKHSSREHVGVLNEIWGSVLSHHFPPPEVHFWSVVARSLHFGGVSVAARMCMQQKLTLQFMFFVCDSTMSVW